MNLREGRWALVYKRVENTIYKRLKVPKWEIFDLLFVIIFYFRKASIGNLGAHIKKNNVLYIGTI